MISIFENKIILTVILAAIIVQALKGTLRCIKEKKLDYSYFLISGGMPSGHSALVVSLAAAIYFTEGLSSIFILSAAFGIVVIYDAMILRMTVGRNNELLREISKKVNINKANHRFTEAHGHTPLQVIIGAVIGIIIAALINTL